MILLQIAILIFSIVAHEVAHGYIAYRRGDDTAYLMGRLTLDPLKHIDPVGSILIPAFCYMSGLPIFGWAKPVPINPTRLDKPRADMGKVALAGPLTNFTLAVICVAAMRGYAFFYPSAEPAGGMLVALQYGVLINLMLCVFNLFPVPPLDGSKVVYSMLPYNAADKYANIFGRYGQWVVIAFIIFGGARYVLFPIVTFIYKMLILAFFWI
ncbi:MAG: site-2 protease family protein [Elusimicrobium sp.]|jgi:Zn-dependent protease|nr:site-2 protease family protein [Elusimicrobium sp.]